MSGRPAVDYPVPAAFGTCKHDLVLDPGQGGLAASGLVPERVVLDVLQHVSDLGNGQEFQRGLSRLAGDVGIPDLEGSGYVSAVGAQQSDDILLGKASLLGEVGEHPALGEEFLEEVLPAFLARPHGHRRERDRHGQDRAVDAEPGDRGRGRQEVEGPPCAREHPNLSPVQLDDQVSHARPAA
jgi:hypothetical protein